MPETAVKSRPISFTTEFVKEILAGRKTQTRRPFKPHGDGTPPNVMRCPYGRPGEFLWVRETWSLTEDRQFIYRADDPVWWGRWHSCRFMPKTAARIWLAITEVRVEHLQDISPQDLAAEGFFVANALSDFKASWDEIYGRASGNYWRANTLVWVISFQLTYRRAVTV